jgi:TatA/E family protein of Tat protein translocase
MFGSIGFPELIIIFAVALLVFGPKKLPEVGRSIGKALREFRRTTDEIKEKLEEEIQADDFKEIKTEINGIKKDLYKDDEGKKIS